MQELLAITREWKKQGYPGSRPVCHGLPGLRVRLIRLVVAELKVRRKKDFEKIRKNIRVRVVVHDPGTVSVMDGATIKKGEDIIVYRDRGSLSTKNEQCAGAVKASDTLRVLDKLKEQERLPLVLCTDNGSPFCAEKVADFLIENQVVHLKSLPRVPEHNGSAENAVNEIKKLVREGIEPEAACSILNQHRLRMTLNYKTSDEVDQERLKLCSQEERARFFEATRAAITAALVGTQSALEKRKAERQAIYQTMESFSLITINRGHRPA